MSWGATVKTTLPPDENINVREPKPPALAEMEVSEVHVETGAAETAKRRQLVCLPTSLAKCTPITVVDVAPVAGTFRREAELGKIPKRSGEESKEMAQLRL